MPDRHDPDRVAPDPVEETTGRHDDFPVRQVWKFGDLPAGFGKPLKPPQALLGAVSKALSGKRLVLSDVLHVREEFGASSRSKPDFQRELRRSSASARTLSRSYPCLSVISR